MNPFFELFQGLTREGPGDTSDVAWAMLNGKIVQNARILDAACGSGADIPALLKASPAGHITGIDAQSYFIDEARLRMGNTPHVDLLVGDMTEVSGPFEAIWCAGAVYFIGITKALETWRNTLAPGGFIAFSEICWWTATPSDPVKAFWQKEYPAMTNSDGIQSHIEAAGYETIATRRVTDRGWEVYFNSLQARIDLLQPTAKPDLITVLDEAQHEINLWRTYRAEFGYLLSVVRPI